MYAHKLETTWRVRSFARVLVGRTRGGGGVMRRAERRWATLLGAAVRAGLTPPSSTRCTAWSCVRPLGFPAEAGHSARTGPRMERLVSGAGLGKEGAGWAMSRG